MSRMLSKMNLISVVQKLPKEDIETIQGYVEMIEEENKQLKEKLDKYENPEDMTLFTMWCTEKVKDENEKLNKKYVNAVADYETTMFEKEQLNSLVNSCQEEIRQLKKQLENKYKKVGTLTCELLYEENTKLINQQKEFIKYLEDVIKELQKIKETELDYDILKDVIPQLLAYEEILQKYKEIIGVSDENNKQ